MTNTETFQMRPIRVDLQLDLYGLDPFEFRIYGHIARRKTCFSNLKTLAAICNMSVRQAQYALKRLEEKNLISKKKRPGKTDIYKINDQNVWNKPDYSESLDNALEYFNRAIIRRELKDLNGALEDFQKSVELFTKELSDTGGKSQRKQKDLSDAEKELKKVQEAIATTEQSA